ncbi:MAG: WG repeat-containing protein [Candidatus Kapaibacterium sp.]
MNNIIFLLLLLGCSSKSLIENKITPRIYSDITSDNDTLYSFLEGKFEYGSPCGYLNGNGDTIIQNGTFEKCFTDTFTTFAFVYDKALYGNGIVAINRDKEVIFDVYLFDNGPDYFSDGLFRILRNGKIGYADISGKVIINAEYECAFPFENGIAKVAYKCEPIHVDDEHSTWESENWLFIDKSGKIIK